MASIPCHIMPDTMTTCGRIGRQGSRQCVTFGFEIIEQGTSSLVYVNRAFDTVVGGGSFVIWEDGVPTANYPNNPGNISGGIQVIDIKGA